MNHSEPKRFDVQLKLDADLLRSFERLSYSQRRWEVLQSLARLHATSGGGIASWLYLWEASRQLGCAAEANAALDGAIGELRQAQSPQLLARLARALTTAGRWTDLADVRRLQIAAFPDKPAFRLLLLEAVAAAGAIQSNAETLEETLAFAANKPAMLTKIAQRLSAFENWGALGRVRTKQIEANPSKFKLIPAHIHDLKRHGLIGEIKPFLEACTNLPLANGHALTLTRIMGREGVETSAFSDWDCQRQKSFLAGLLEHAEEVAALGREDEARSLYRSVRDSLLQLSDDARETVKLEVSWIKRDPSSWFDSDYLEFPSTKLGLMVEYLSAMSAKKGSLEIWSGYSDQDIKGASRTRSPSEVRVARRYGEFLAWLGRRQHPLQIVEIGTAFGVSGMYWLSGLEEAGEGRLLTFEPNAVWQSIAKRNLSIISDRAASVASTFEDAIASGQIPERSLDILFIDGIHTASAVRAQIDAALRLLKEGAIIVLDDIQFSPGFYGYWKDLANDSRVKASFEVEGRLGLIEF